MNFHNQLSQNKTKKNENSNNFFFHSFPISTLPSLYFNPPKKKAAEFPPRKSALIFRSPFFPPRRISTLYSTQALASEHICHLPPEKRHYMKREQRGRRKEKSKVIHHSRSTPKLPLPCATHSHRSLFCYADIMDLCIPCIPCVYFSVRNFHVQRKFASARIELKLSSKVWSTLARQQHLKESEKSSMIFHSIKTSSECHFNNIWSISRKGRECVELRSLSA